MMGLEAFLMGLQDLGKGDAMRIFEVMTRRVQTLSENDRMDLASAVLSFWKYRHLPVVDPDHRVVGMVTPAEVLEAVQKRGMTGPITVSEVMRRPARTIREDEHITAALPRMKEAGMHALPVVDEAGRLVGIATDVDVLVSAARDRPRGID